MVVVAVVDVVALAGSVEDVAAPVVTKAMAMVKDSMVVMDAMAAVKRVVVEVGEVRQYVPELMPCLSSRESCQN